ncbi:MAG: helix-turn-helix domain-containing protein [Candidatus Eremiobacteraeota bacterium]|nr:helix-turn-helix domain-containing protein [Candidatus Eremiobacteraeota bacterium]
MDARRVELGNFLRAKRAAVPISEGRRRSRRRPNGATISEIAASAGVGTTWYSAFERGMPIRVSRKMLDNLANALRLDESERAYLRRLAEPDVTLPQGSPVEPVLLEVVNGFTTGPAFVMNDRWDVLACNAIAAVVYFLSPDDPPAQHNLLRRMFGDPRYREMHADWQGLAARMVSILHMAYAKHAGDDAYETFIAELRGYPDFTSIWERYSVAEYVPTHAELRHPVLGLLEFEYVSFDLSGEHVSRRLVLHPPVPGSGTAERIVEQMREMTTARSAQNLASSHHKN